MSQAATDEFRAGHERAFGEYRPGQRGRWIYDPAQGKCVRAEEYRPEPLALNAPIIADRIHEGTTFDDGERVRDIGSRRKRREFLRETGLVEAADCSKGWLESQAKARERAVERKIEGAAEEAARKLYHQGKMRD